MHKYVEERATKDGYETVSTLGVKLKLTKKADKRWEAREKLEVRLFEGIRSRETTLLTK